MAGPLRIAFAEPHPVLQFPPADGHRVLTLNP